MDEGGKPILCERMCGAIENSFDFFFDHFLPFVAVGTAVRTNQHTHTQREREHSNIHNIHLRLDKMNNVKDLRRFMFSILGAIFYGVIIFSMF